MVSDSLIAFKTSILYILGIYVLMLMQFFQQSPRPYWIKDDLPLFQNTCYLSYAGPSYHIFNVQFIPAYFIYNIMYVYNDKPNIVMIYITYGTLIAFNLTVGFCQMFLAQLFAYEIVQTTLVTMIYLMIVIQFDKEIMKMTE